MNVFMIIFTVYLCPLLYYDDLIIWLTLCGSIYLPEDFATYYTINKYVEFFVTVKLYTPAANSSARGIMS